MNKWNKENEKYLHMYEWKNTNDNDDNDDNDNNDDSVLKFEEIYISEKKR